jgi:hypothetical protein
LVAGGSSACLALGAGIPAVKVPFDGLPRTWVKSDVPTDPWKLLPAREVSEEFILEKLVPELFRLTGNPGDASGIKLGVVVSDPNPVVPKSVASKTNCSPISCPINQGPGIGDTSPGLVPVGGKTDPETEKPWNRLAALTGGPTAQKQQSANRVSLRIRASTEAPRPPFHSSPGR